MFADDVLICWERREQEEERGNKTDNMCEDEASG